ncbi:MAG TPA: hypothetical protein VK541_00735 [Pedobacter sp.]|uniref:hypothetical protein n=1 Tax=Pedobacter sp. TaxID=1411316 RepID=UPI002C80A664|nr:hypothetical protein [Pedobacter sp.]HMI00971.1 hypothetical protein [Pedobacter sp.]
MSLKNIVDGILKEKNRPMSWLADEMGKTFDGLKLSLVKGSIKYNDIIEMAKRLEVPPAVFFRTEHAYGDYNNGDSVLAEAKENYGDLKGNLKNCKEMLAALKDQLKDKETIISLLNRGA